MYIFAQLVDFMQWIIADFSQAFSLSNEELNSAS